MWLKLSSFVFDTFLGKATAALLGVIGLVAWFGIHNANQRAIGETRAHAATEKANAVATKRAAAAAAKSADPAARGLRNPHYRAD
jgi:hypothetical protein